MTLLIPDSLEKHPDELNRHYAERVLEYNIVTLNLPPGLIISEKDIAAELGISRTPVHEALIELSKKSLTNIIPQVGTRISLIDIKKVEAICFLRYTAEIEMIHHLIDKIDETGIKRLGYLIERQREAQRQLDYLQFLEDDNALHALLFREAELEEVGMLLQAALPNFNRVRMLIYRNLNLNRIIGEHIDLVCALEEKDLPRALEVMTNHLSHDVVRDLNTLKQKFPEYFLFPNNRVY